MCSLCWNGAFGGIKLNSIRANPLWARLMHLLRFSGNRLPERIYRHLWFQGVFNAQVNGASFQMLHPGSVLENQLFWRNNFEGERTVVAAIGEHIDRADAFLDVGANTGFYSLYAKARKPTLDVLAFEPSPVNFGLLRQNIELNGFDIEAFETAVTDKDGEVTLYDFGEHSYSASLVEDFRSGAVPRKVPGETLDTIAEHHRLLGRKLLIKVDVEGHEEAVLAGASRVIGTGPTLMIEILTDVAAKAVAQRLGPDRFSYRFADESSGEMVDLTPKFATGGKVRHGNYFVMPVDRF